MDLEEKKLIDLFEKEKQAPINEDLIKLNEQQKKGLQIFEDMDPNDQCFSKVMHACHETFALYHVILDEEKNTVQRNSQPVSY